MEKGIGMQFDFVLLVADGVGFIASLILFVLFLGRKDV